MGAAAAIKKQNSFGRIIANEAKLGAYYTDIGMCRKINNLLSFTDREICVLEPSIGDAKAVLAVTGKESGTSDNIKVFGVEINKETYGEYLKQNPQVDYSINADFLNGVKISHSCFSMCFANPPYGEGENGQRLEIAFTEKLYPYLKSGAVYVLVIPEYVLRSEQFQRSFMARFGPLGEWRFDEEVYRQFKQVVVIGRKKNALGYSKEALAAWQERFADELPCLPDEPEEEPIRVFGSSEKSIEYFTTLEFRAEEALQMLQRSALVSLSIGRRLYKGAYCAAELGHPIVPLSPDMCYLVSSVGGGQGFAGSEADGTLHLQRGKAEVVKTSSIETTEDGATYEKEVSSTKITLKIIESDGTITDLK